MNYFVGNTSIFNCEQLNSYTTAAVKKREQIVEDMVDIFLREIEYMLTIAAKHDYVGNSMESINISQMARSENVINNLKKGYDNMPDLKDNELEFIITELKEKLESSGFSVTYSYDDLLGFKMVIKWGISVIVDQ
jgi:hypothetical protein